jgi:hypothetical protein
MDLSPEEKVALAAEWKRSQGFGQRLTRQKAIATLAGCAVMVPFLALGLLLVVALRSPRPITALLITSAGLKPAWSVRNRLWPKGAGA